MKASFKQSYVFLMLLYHYLDVKQLLNKIMLWILHNCCDFMTLDYVLGKVLEQNICLE